MEASDWSAIAAWIALGIGIVNLGYSVVGPWWRGRKASPAAQLDLLNPTTQSGLREEVRVVITNHGPAMMHDVSVQVFDENGMSLVATDANISALWPSMPVQFLHPSQSLYLTLNLSLGTPTARQAQVTWHDKRRAEQQRWIDLSYNRVV